MKAAALLLGAGLLAVWLITCRTPPQPLPVPKVSNQPRPSVSAAKPRPSRKPKPSGFNLVRPAPRGFKPESQEPRVKLTLIAESDFIHRGTSFWYRLELQNVGRQPLEWHETRSFFEDGFLLNAQFQFFLTQPDGRSVQMLPPIDRDEQDSGPGLSLKLKAGETLVTRPWSYLGLPELSWGPFRELASRYRFEVLGTYKIAAYLRARGSAAAVESNSISFEVVP